MIKYQLNQALTSRFESFWSIVHIIFPISATHSLKTAVPVWKAKYTPFGDGLATVIVHMQRNDHSLFLWNYKHLDFPVHSFFGHKDVILDFDWRKPHHTDDLQMVTWSRDSTLRIWSVELNTQYQCGVEASDDTSSMCTVWKFHDFLSLRFYVKSFLGIFECAKSAFSTLLEAQKWNFKNF